MFIGLVSVLNATNGKPVMRYFDAHKIIQVRDSEFREGCLFWFDDGNTEGAIEYEAISYDAAGLIELVMQARLAPEQFLPSNNVGKSDRGETSHKSTGSLKWSAKDNR